MALKYIPDTVSNWLSEEDEEEWEEIDAPTVVQTVPISTQQGTTSIIVNPTVVSSKETATADTTNPTSSSSTTASTAVPVALPAVPVKRKKIKGSTATTAHQAEDDGGILAKLQNYRNMAVKTRDHLKDVQNSVHECNIKMLKIEG